MKSYPIINESVSFARADETGETHTGTGKVQAIFVGMPDRRLMVQVKEETGAAWNVDLAMINPSEEELETYRSAVKEVQAITEEGNGKVKALVEEYNEKVQAVYVRVLGELVEV